MSGVSILAVCNIIPIQLQLPSGDTNQFPQVSIYNSSGTTILCSPINLSHVAGGLYAPSCSVFMPDQAFIMLQFINYTCACHAAESATNKRDSNLFTRCPLTNTVLTQCDICCIVCEIWNAQLPGCFCLGSAGSILSDTSDNVELIENTVNTTNTTVNSISTNNGLILKIVRFIQAILFTKT